MLDFLSLKNFVLIDQLEIDFSSGLSVLTGETGAGKSILLDAISLLFGARTDVKFIRHGQDKTTLTARLTLSKTKYDFLKNEMVAVGLDLESNELTLRRQITKEGKSQAFLNDQAVSLSLLKMMSDHLIDIIGQFHTQSLFETKNHIIALDDYGRMQKDLQHMNTLYHQMKRTEKEYSDLYNDIEKSKSDFEYLTHALSELEELKPEANEEEILLEKRSLQMSKQKIMETYKDVESLFSYKDAPNTHILKVLRMLDRQPDHIRTIFTDVAEILNRASIELSEAENHLSAMRLDDPTDLSLDDIEERLSALRQIARKHHILPIALIDKKDEIEKKLSLFSSQEASLEKAQQARLEAQNSYCDYAEKLHQKRLQNAENLKTQIMKELSPLKLNHAQFVVQVSKIELEQALSYGLSKVEFLISTGTGTPPAALQKVASGGELSRLMLALKLVLHQNDAAETLIFDEIDTGVGGSVASAIGERLKKLSHSKQVFLVTHSPQIASFADRHYLVEKAKRDNEKVLTSKIHLLNNTDHLEELARMLSGAKITDEARAAAKSLADKAIAA